MRLIFPLGALVAALLTGTAGCELDHLPPTPPAPEPQPSPPQPGPIPGDASVVDAGPRDASADFDANDLSCGGLGDDCCGAAPFCVAEFSHCGELGTCGPCGSGGQQCCTEGDPCRPNLSCAAGMCSP